jgi:enoyl-CoA hydratase/carnithine racemase
MNEIFKYNTLNAYLKPATKSLIISTKNETYESGLTTEWIFELDSILQWAFDKIEIQSIFLTGDGQSFAPALVAKDIALKEKDFWIKIHNKINAINKLLLKLPQTIVLDMKYGNANVGLDIGISADIVIGHRSGQWNFNYLNLGTSPLSLHLFGSEKFPSGVLDQWILSNSQIPHSELNLYKFFNCLYDETDRQHCIQTTLEKILQQAPVSRIQTKLALKRAFVERIDAQILADQKIFQGTLMSEEWKLWPIQKKQTGTLPVIKKQQVNRAINAKKPDNVIALRRDN